jgi:hypothetical protein
VVTVTDRGRHGVKLQAIPSATARRLHGPKTEPVLIAQGLIGPGLIAQGLIARLAPGPTTDQFPIDQDLTARVLIVEVVPNPGLAARTLVVRTRIDMDQTVLRGIDLDRAARHLIVSVAIVLVPIDPVLSHLAASVRLGDLGTVEVTDPTVERAPTLVQVAREEVATNGLRVPVAAQIGLHHLGHMTVNDQHATIVLRVKVRAVGPTEPRERGRGRTAIAPAVPDPTAEVLVRGPGPAPVDLGVLHRGAAVQLQVSKARPS